MWTKGELETAIYAKSANASPKRSRETETDSEADEERSQTQRPLESYAIPEHLQHLLAKDARSNASRGAAITITMVAVALGFACCENIVYIFIYSENTIAVGKYVSDAGIFSRFSNILIRFRQKYLCWWLA